MKARTSRIVKRVLSGMLSLVMTASLASALPSVSAQETDKYPYVLFALSENDGAITVNAQSFNVNGDIATNGSLYTAGNMNLNGMKTENVGESMPFFIDKLEEVYFRGEYELCDTDYSLSNSNINISTPIKVQGSSSLEGNINISSALMVQNNVDIEGITINGNNGVLCAQYGNVSIEGQNVNFSGIIYAPMGTVEITAENISLNSVVVIADEIILDANNVNVGYSSWAGQLVGTDFSESPDEETDYEKDTDEDGIPDFIEDEFGTDIKSSDTDGDGLTDLYELVNGITDPAIPDTDSDGISDADEDYDSDGLTNIREHIQETNPADKDSDSDGVSDGDEINVHNTNPLSKDSDGDGLTDGEEIYFETDPNNKDTDGNGISDGDEKREQSFEYDYSDWDCAVTDVSITMNASGNVYRTTSIKSVMDKDILCSDVVGLVGEPFEIETTSQFDSATITFKVDRTKLQDTQFDELIFLWYDEENYRFVEMETTYDEQNNTVSTQTTHFSKYMIVDSAEWFTAWSNAYAKYDTFANRTIHTVICYDCSASMETYDPYFIQYQYGNHGELIEQDYTNGRILAINSYIDAMRTNLINNDRLALVRFADSARLVHSMSGDKDSLRSSIEISNKGGTHANLAIPYALRQFELYSRSASVKNIIMLTDGQFTITEYNLNRLLERDIQLYIVGLGNSISSEKIAEYTAYENVEYYAAATGEQLEEIYENLAGRHRFNLSVLADNDSDGMPDDFEVSGMVSQNGTIHYSDPDNPDTDGDGLLDGYEISYEIDKAVHYNYGLKQDETTYYSVSFTMYSDPSEKDSDGDGLEDNEDITPNEETVVIDSQTAEALILYLQDQLGLIMPPTRTRDGEVINSQNKECAETKEYFDGVIWPYRREVLWESYGKNPLYKHNVDMQYYPSYVNWLRSAYGAHGLESFWVTTDCYTSALYYELSNIGETFESAKEQILLGNYSDEITITGTSGQIIVGISGIDFVADLRDVTYDATHWEWSWSHIGQTVLDSVGLIPVVGVIKNVDELKNIDELIDAVKSLDKFSGSLELSDEVKAQIKSLIKNADEATKLKIKENPEFWAKLATQVGENDDLVVLGKFNASPNYLEVAEDLKATHYDNEFWDELNKLFDNDEIEMWKINEAFLKQQTAAKKTIIFSQDPKIAKTANGRWDSSSFGRELDYLENTAKYRISDTVNELGYYYAVPIE